MAKTKKVVYWVSTVWLALGMVSTAAVQLARRDEEVASITQLGYPVYFLTLLGVWKILGAVAVLVPKHPVLKEWAYAGFFFAMSGASLSHVASVNSAVEIAPSLLLLILTVVSWASRPADRKLASSPKLQTA